MVFELNLDLPESKRWDSIIESNKEKINSSLPHIKSLLSQFDPIIGRAKLAIKAASLIGKVKNAKELKALAKAFSLSFGEMMLLQLCFEFYGGCTTVSAKVNNSPILFHSFDYPLQIFKDLLIEVRFTKGLQEIARGITFIGYVGIITGVKDNNFSVSINYRQNSFSSILEFLEKNKLSLISKVPASFAIREALEKEDLPGAIDMIKKKDLIFDCFISFLSPEGEHTIIKSHSSFTSLFPTVVVNNEENELNDPLYSNERRRVITSLLGEKSSFSSVEEAVETLSTYPVVNEQTIYISLTSPVDGELKYLTS